MRLSTLFTKTSKTSPKNEESKNADLLVRAGYVYKEMSGAYVYLPLGLRVLNKIIQIIREEMNAIGGQELFMTALQNKDVWEATERWSDEVVDDWFKTKLKNETELGLGFTHEEPITKMMTQYINSYKDLPFSAYQFQTKFRNELRAKSGIMRGREFIMKDLYSFSRSREEHEKFYEEAKNAYHKIFERVGLGDKTFLTFASGGSFSKFSHEFQTLCEAGEDEVYLDSASKIAVNQEVYSPEVLKELDLKEENLEKVKAAEVGNIFTLGTKFSDAFSLEFTDEDGVQKPVFMGSYGIGPGRTMGVVVEAFADEKGLIWPESIAPAQVHIVSIGEQGAKQAQELYNKLLENGVEVIFDDRDQSPGQKLADADLLGVPCRVVASNRTAAEGEFEFKKRTSDDSQLLTYDQLLEQLT